MCLFNSPAPLSYFREHIFFIFTAPFFIFTAGDLFCRFAPKSPPRPPMPLLFTPIPAKINNPFTSFYFIHFPHRSAPLDLFSADPIPIPCESKWDGESGQAALYFYREQSCREGTYIAALSLYRAKRDRSLELHRGENLFSPLLSSLWFFLFSHALSLPVFL